MTASTFTLLAVCAWLPANLGYAADRPDPLAPIPGFELRLLDKTLPVTVTSGGKANSFVGPLWFYIPTRADARLDIDVLTESNDLDLGTSLLPQPPAGIGLRALKVPLKKSYVLSDGRRTEIEYPVFIYFRRIALPESETSKTDARVFYPADAALPVQNEQRLLSELAALNRELVALVPAIGEPHPREKIATISRQVAALIVPARAVDPLAPADSNIR